MPSEHYYKENRDHSSELIPFSYYKSQIPDYFPNVPLHWHKEFELNYILSGQGEFIIGDEKLTAEKGDIIIISPNVLHAVSPIGTTIQRYDTIVFNLDMLLGIHKDRSCLDFFLPLSEHSLGIATKISTEHNRYQELKDCILEIFIHAKKNTAVNDIFLKCALLRFFAILAQNNDLQPITKKESIPNELIRPAITYINEHFMEKITIEQLANTAHMSKSYFMGTFKKQVGMGAINYINQLRIKSACELLRSKNQNVSEIAFSCGFTNLSNFNRQFRRQIGITPKEYAKLYKKETRRSK